jgi:leucyl-tRNA synthetase
VNGRLKATIEIAKSANQNEALDAAKKCEAVSPAISGKNIIKEIYVPGKIVNFVVK